MPRSTRTRPPRPKPSRRAMSCLLATVVNANTATTDVGMPRCSSRTIAQAEPAESEPALQWARTSLCVTHRVNGLGPAFGEEEARPARAPLLLPSRRGTPGRRRATRLSFVLSEREPGGGGDARIRRNAAVRRLGYGALARGLDPSDAVVGRGLPGAARLSSQLTSPASGAWGGQVAPRRGYGRAERGLACHAWRPSR